MTILSAGFQRKALAWVFRPVIEWRKELREKKTKKKNWKTFSQLNTTVADRNDAIGGNIIEFFAIFIPTETQSVH